MSSSPHPLSPSDAVSSHVVETGPSWKFSSNVDRPQGRVGACLDGFLSKCLEEQPNIACESAWGESSGLSAKDPQNLVRPSSVQAQLPRTDDLALLVMMDSRQPTWAQLVCPGVVVTDNGQCETSMVNGVGTPTFLDTPVDSNTNLEVVPLFAAAPFGGPVAGVVIGETRRTAQISAIAVTSVGTSMKAVRQRSRRVILEEDQVEKCPICLDGLLKGDHVQTLPCFHRLHRRCCTKYFRTSGVKPLCPVCRFDMAAI